MNLAITVFYTIVRINNQFILNLQLIKKSFWQQERIKRAKNKKY